MQQWQKTNALMTNFIPKMYQAKKYLQAKAKMILSDIKKQIM